MRRVQIHLDEAVDDHLAAEAARRALSKAALIRALLAETLDLEAAPDDPFDELVGSLDTEPADVDEVVYG